jgi:hypothetical protein
MGRPFRYLMSLPNGFLSNDMVEATDEDREILMEKEQIEGVSR